MVYRLVDNDTRGASRGQALFPFFGVATPVSSQVLCVALVGWGLGEATRPGDQPQKTQGFLFLASFSLMTRRTQNMACLRPVDRPKTGNRA